MSYPVLIFIVFLAVFQAPEAQAQRQTLIRLHNSCQIPIWPAWISYATPQHSGPATRAVRTGESFLLRAPSGWTGKIWGRTNCSRGPPDNYFRCQTGDCGAETCGSTIFSDSATIADFKPLGANNTDQYEVTLVNTVFNLPVLVAPTNSSCHPAGYTAEQAKDQCRKCPRVSGGSCSSGTDYIITFCA